MAASPFSLLVCVLLLRNPLHSAANVHKRRDLLRSDALLQPASPSPLQIDPVPTRFFEVTAPIEVPPTQPCSKLVLHHDFGYTYGEPPVLAQYSPPSHCPFHRFSKIVFEWNATCAGRQYDRIFGVWMSRVEVFRSCTAEPRSTGIVWTVRKDITRYRSLLVKNQTLAVYLGNVVTTTYTGIYHVNITILFYPAHGSSTSTHSVPHTENSISGYASAADLILPISRKPPLNDGFWFEIQNDTDTQTTQFQIPPNAYRAVLEVYVSFHENDEFWYSNPPSEYIIENNLTDPGNGAFREVVVILDGLVVGAIYPFTVIYTGGVNPLLWRPVTGIGSFDLPSYDVEITPFLGNLLDGNTHKIAFSVTNALNVWYIDANLHLWLDKKSTKTEGKLVSHTGLPSSISLVSDFKGLNGKFLTGARRRISSTGWVKSSLGNITTEFTQGFSYNNSMLMGKDGDLQIVNQTIEFNTGVQATMSSSSVLSSKSYKRFLIRLYSDVLDQGDQTSVYITNVTLGFDENAEYGSSVSSLKNLQNAQGYMVVENNLVVQGLGSTQQVYRKDDSGYCYFRNISVSNYTILSDQLRNACQEGALSRLASKFSRWWPFRLSLQESF